MEIQKKILLEKGFNVEINEQIDSTISKTSQEIIKQLEQAYDGNILETQESNSKVYIELGDSEKKHKFVLMHDENNQSYVVALPIETHQYHREISEFARNHYGKDLNVNGGGYIHIENDELVISKTSERYGEAPKLIVEEILKNHFPNINIKSIANPKPISNTEKEVKRKSENLKKALDSFDSTVKKEFYAGVLEWEPMLSNNQAMRLGHDKAHAPQMIENKEDLAYMIYSSENGSSFGFDTLYVGYKNKDGEIVHQAIVRERFDIVIDEIKCENNEIKIKYNTQSNGEEEIKIPLDEIENFKMISNLEGHDEILCENYKFGQIAHKNSYIHHGG